jgi:hypothetical protein
LTHRFAAHTCHWTVQLCSACSTTMLVIQWHAPRKVTRVPVDSVNPVQTLKGPPVSIHCTKQ